MRGLLGDRGPDEAPRLGLAGMAPPQVARRSLSEIEADLLPRPVKAPITPSDVLLPRSRRGSRPHYLLSRMGKPSPHRC